MKVEGAIIITELKYKKISDDVAKNQIRQLVLSEDDARELWQQIGLKLRTLQKEKKP